MNSRDDVVYRLNLAKGFLKEAEQDMSLGRWRSCVANAQLCAENSGKAVLMLFQIPGKTHQPGVQLAKLADEGDMPDDVRSAVGKLLPELATLGAEEHFMTDYGDEVSHTLPWDIYDKHSAGVALESARVCLSIASHIVDKTRNRRAQR